MRYYINFGNVHNIELDVINKLLSEHKSDKGIGIDKLVNIGFDKLSDKKTSNDDRESIISNYWSVADDVFVNSEYREENWVTSKDLNRNRGYSSRNISSEFIEGMKKIRGGREFFRSIKDEYSDNSSYPNIEVSLINTSAFKNSLKLLSNEVINNKDLTLEQIDFSKWVFWWGTQSLKRKGNKASIRFSRD